jgi:hypothetical protein
VARSARMAGFERVRRHARNSVRSRRILAETWASKFVRGSRYSLASLLGREYWSSGQMRYREGYSVLSGEAVSWSSEPGELRRRRSASQMPQRTLRKGWAPRDAHFAPRRTPTLCRDERRWKIAFAGGLKNGTRGIGKRRARCEAEGASAKSPALRASALLAGTSLAGARLAVGTTGWSDPFRE